MSPNNLNTIFFFTMQIIKQQNSNYLYKMGFILWEKWTLQLCFLQNGKYTKH